MNCLEHFICISLTLGSNLKETLIFNWNVIQFGSLWAGNLLRHFLMIVELSVIPTNDSLIIRLNYLNLSFTLFLYSTVVSWTAALNSAKSYWAFGVEGLIQNKHKWNVLCNLPRNWWKSFTGKGWKNFFFKFCYTLISVRSWSFFLDGS